LVTEFLTIEKGTIIFTLINMVILFLLIRHFLFDKVNNVIESRQEEVKNTYEEANNANEKAKKLELDYSEKLSMAKEESAEIVKSATKKAQSRSDEIINDAKLEASNIIQRSNSEIEREKKRAVNQIKDEISDIAFMVATKVIEKEIDKKDNDRLIEDFIKNVGEL